LGERVQAADAGRRKHAEQPVAERVDDERVTAPPALVGKEPRRIAEHPEPGSDPRNDSRNERWHGLDRAARGRGGLDRRHSRDLQWRRRGRRTELRMGRTTAPRTAGQNPATTNPGTMADAKPSMSALMTKRKSPNVRIVRGKVTIFSSKPIVALTSPI